MKFLSLLLAFLLTATTVVAQTPPPVSIKGQESTTKLLPKWNLQVPNKTATNVGGIDALIETGNKNLLDNSSFEHSTFDTGWTCTGITPVKETTVMAPGAGKTGVVLAGSATSFECYQDSTTGNVYASGAQFLAQAKLRAASTVTGTIKVCSRSAGTTSTTLCQTLVNNGVWNTLRVPFTGSTTSNGISIVGTTVTGNVYLDDAYMGPADLIVNVDQSRLAGESYFAGTTGCVWQRTSTTVGAVAAVTACPGPTIVNSSMGNWQTTDSDLPRQTITNLPAGTYKATFILASNMNTSNAATAFAINDGTTTCEAVNGENSTAAASNIVVSCSFKYNTMGDRTFELYTASGANAIQINNNGTAPRVSTKFILEYFGSGSVYTSTNADTDWGACSFSTLAWQGLGTVTHSLMCKRQGSDLLMKGQVVLGTVAASEARFLLPTWNGSQLTLKSSAVANPLGRIIRGVTGTSVPKDFVAIAISTPGTNYFGASYVEYAQTQSPYSLQTGSQMWGNGEAIGLDLRIPIDGWDQSNIIIGQFNGLESCADTYTCTDTFSAKVSSAGVVTDENVDWINGNCTITSTNRFTCAYKSGLNGNGVSLTNKLNCVVKDQSVAQTTIFMVHEDVSSSTSSQLVYDTYSGTTTQSADPRAVNIICQKAGSDYVGKTAKAVASDQNLWAPGMTKMKKCIQFFGSTGSLSSPTVCGSGTCTEYYDNCGTGSTGFNSTGNYTSSWAAGTWLANTPLTCGSQVSNGYNFLGVTFATYPVSSGTGGTAQQYAANINGGAATNIYGMVWCEGMAP